jgi:hypothetical protein
MEKKFLNRLALALIFAGWFALLIWLLPRTLGTAT